MPEVPSTPSHERSDISARGAAWFALALVFGVALTGVVIWWMEMRLDHSGPAWPHQPTAANPKFQSPAPALQVASTEDLVTFRAAEDKALQNYQWVDRKAGVIRIPVDRAREIILQRGLPKTSTAMPLPGPPPTAGDTQPSQAPVSDLRKGGAP